MNSKRRKQLCKQLNALEHQQLVALGSQKTNVPFQTLLKTSKEDLVEILITVDGVLKPEEV